MEQKEFGWTKGYEVQLAPIYTLAFYNAIANNGKFLEPLFVKSISQNGIEVKKISAWVINPQICSPSTLNDVRQTLLGVVEKPKYGTGEAVHSPYVRIAGKTGTAQISKGSAGYTSGAKRSKFRFVAFPPTKIPVTRALPNGSWYSKHRHRLSTSKATRFSWPKRANRR